jgi:protein-S-isoprenylcysteine O-methyltransferase Ste14
VKSRFVTGLRSVAAPAVIGALIFAVAGRWDLPFVWGVLGVMIAFYVLLALFADPGMVEERQAPGPGSRDRFTQPVAGTLLLGHWILVGLDVGHFHWSPVPWEIQVAGLVTYAAALGINFWAMWVNRFYSSVVRVQTDRGHHAVIDGPYRFVRHPGYAATLVAVLGGGIALGSWLAMLPLLGFAATFVRRTLVEDRILQAELPGYAAYCKRVRSRLIPGVF